MMQGFVIFTEKATRKSGLKSHRAVSLKERKRISGLFEIKGSYI